MNLKGTFRLNQLFSGKAAFISKHQNFEKCRKFFIPAKSLMVPKYPKGNTLISQNAFREPNAFEIEKVERVPFDK